MIGDKFALDYILIIYFTPQSSKLSVQFAYVLDFEISSFLPKLHLIFEDVSF